VASYWGTSHYEDSGGQYSCGTTWEINQGVNKVDEVYNPCNSRVWVHNYSDSDLVKKLPRILIPMSATARSGVLSRMPRGRSYYELKY
jgi:hypothetical protein